MDPALFERDVLAGPAVLDRVVETAALDELVAQANGRRIVLIGMGSSRFAAITAMVHLQARGLNVATEFASAGLRTPPARDVLAIGISASGSTPETLAALERHHGTSATAAITNAPEAEIAAVADVVVPLGAGVEEGGVACRSFACTLALLLAFVGRVGRGPDLRSGIRRGVEAQAGLVDDRERWLPDLVERVGNRRPLFTIAPAERISSALQGALMLREGPRIVAAGCETGDWLHVDVYLSKHAGYQAVLYGGTPYDDGILEWARQRQSAIAVVGPPIDGAALAIRHTAEGDPVASAVAETVVAELLAARMWLTSGDHE